MGNDGNNSEPLALVTISDLRVILARMDERLGHIEGALKRDYQVLHGNGQPGVIDRLTRLEEARRSVWGVVQAIGTVLLSLASMAVAIYAALRGGR